MGVGRIQIWVPDFKDNCVIDNDNTFVATVQHCDGKVLQWRGGRYQTKDGNWRQIVGDPHGLKPGTPGFYDGVPGTGDPGHITFEVPPGCYTISASTHVWVQPAAGGQKALVGNLSTHKTVVCVCCDEDACVTLFQPTGFHCGIIQVLDLLLPVMEVRGFIKKEERANADKALRPLIERIQPSAFDQNELKMVTPTIVRRLSRGGRPASAAKSAKKGKKR
ncbi:MAG: hypothetical protein H7Y30_08115 [Pyrinomonadaceae bacterium]|nr:hypothetical protein [Pyrinomonadaceae bacterium]